MPPVLSCPPCSRAPVFSCPVLSCSRALVPPCSRARRARAQDAKVSTILFGSAVSVACMFCGRIWGERTTTLRERRRHRNCERTRDCAETSVCLRAHASRFAIAIASSLGGRKWCSLRKQHPGPALALGLCPQHSQQRGRPVGVVSAESLEVRPSLKSFKSLDARLRACKGNHLTTQSTIRCWL